MFVRDHNCPWCLRFEYKMPVCSYPCGTYEAGTLTWFKLIGIIDKYYAITRESKCKAKGDFYCELSVYYIPKELSIEKFAKNKPELFTIIKPEDSIKAFNEIFG